ncbi:hypothetical protein F383_20029 [Gossypium arboreum]|uniref:Uncharacterized protein n=1 Tax=Gossypium arboreum TaxID=29729 RepID=A0A0B0NR83_GOSAR|nr:hypothetical protein F383_20029 [Gossypium arboreum]
MIEVYNVLLYTNLLWDCVDFVNERINVEMQIRKNAGLSTFVS